MRVLIVCLSVNFFGTERHAVELANALADGHEVGLVLRAPPDDLARRPGYDALRAAVAPGVAVFLAGRAVPLIGLARAALAFRPHIIHAHNERSARWAARLPFRAPLVATNHCGYAADYQRCDALICLTEAQIAALPAAFRGRRACIGNWVLPWPRPSDEQILGLRASLGIAADDYVVGSVGRLDPEKGHADLIEGFRAAGVPGAKLVIVGGGGEAARLRAMAGDDDRVILTGFRRDVRDLYPAFDLCVLNSRSEPFGLTVLEALDAGLPVIATATDGAREIAARSPIRLIPVGDRAALVAALRAARAGKVAPPPEGAAPFRLAAVLPKILAVYDAVLRRPATSYDKTMPRTTQT